MSNKNLTKRLTGVFAASALVIGLGLAAQSASAAVVDGVISGSKHDLTTLGASGNKATGPAGAAAEICVFCHTPHGGNQTVAPLWNRIAPASAGFTPYTSTTMNYANVNTNMGTRSTMCLSCHDGATAMDTVINGPGSGPTLTGGRMTGYTWAPQANGQMLAGVFALLGTDLSNDHPVGIPYCGGATAAYVPVNGSNSIAASLCRDVDFNPYFKDASNAFWVDTVGTGSLTVKDKTDMALYASGIAGFNGVPSVECSSCHEPHSASTTTTSFLRTANTGSRICLACHKK